MNACVTFERDLYELLTFLWFSGWFRVHYKAQNNSSFNLYHE